MDKYQAVTAIGIMQVTFMTIILISAGIFRNWYLLFLLLLCGTKKSERRVLGLKEED